MTAPAPADTHARGAELLLGAFHAARDAGRSEWRSMTTAVLKNRVLDLTSREFREEDWGVSSFSEFLGQFPDVIRVDPTTRPPTARLVHESAGAEPRASGDEARELGRQRRIRPDLWTSVVDYSSGQEYVWDGSAAVPLGPGQIAGGADQKRLPTLSEDDFKHWREEFVSREVEEYPTWEQSLTQWRDAGHGVAALPARFRGSWIAELKRRVLERLEIWFQENQVTVPQNVLQDASSTREPSPEIENLRELVVDCVRVMSRAELDQLRLPPSVILRAKARDSS